MLGDVLGDVVAYVNLLDQRVLDSGSGPGHARSTSDDLFPNQMEGTEGAGHLVTPRPLVSQGSHSMYAAQRGLNGGWETCWLAATNQTTRGKRRR